MRTPWLWMIVACGGTPKGTPGDTADGSDPCPVRGAALDDPASNLPSPAHACEDAPYYIPEVPTATSFYVGDFQIDDCGEITGIERQLLFANPAWIAADGGDCEVVWRVSGQVVASALGDRGLQLTAEVDPAATTCPEDADGTPIYVGSTVFEVTYHTVQLPGGDVDVLFESGTLLGRGQWNEGHVTYASDFRCDTF